MTQSDAEFDIFWSAFPNRKHKGDARKAWLQTAPIRPPLAELLEAVERGKRSVEWHECNRSGRVGAYIPLPATYLRGERWADEYTVALCAIRTHDLKPAKAPAVVPPSAEQIAKSREALRLVRKHV